MTAQQRRRRWPWWLGAVLLLVIITLALLGLRWQSQRHALDQQVQARLSTHPMVLGHVGDAPAFTRTTPTPTPGERYRHDMIAYAVRGSLGTGTVMVHVATRGDAVTIDDGTLRMADGLTYPLQDIDTGGADPLARRIEFVARSAHAANTHAETTRAPNLMVALDAGANITDAQLMRFARSRLVPALARVPGVATIWSLHGPRDTAMTLLVLSADATRLENAGIASNALGPALIAAGFQPAPGSHDIFAVPALSQERLSPAMLVGVVPVHGDHGDRPLAELASMKLTIRTSRMALGLIVPPDDVATAVTAVQQAIATVAVPPGIRINGCVSDCLRIDQPAASPVPAPRRQ